MKNCASKHAMKLLLLLAVVLSLLISGAPSSLAESSTASSSTAGRSTSSSAKTMSAHKKTTKKKKKKARKKKKPVTSCTGGTPGAGEHAYFDAGLVTAMNRLVCSAADGSTIKIKSWFIADDSALTKRFFANLAIMHRYHRVKIYFHVGREHRDGIDKMWRALVKRSRGLAYTASCYYGCRTSARDSVSHSKWITVSKLRSSRRPAVLQMSANITGRQLAKQHQAGVLVVGNAGVNKLFDHEYGVYWACGTRHRCPKHAPAGRWTTYNRVSVHFTPTTNDLIARELDRVNCSRGGHVYASSRVYNGSGVVNELNRIARRGCTVRIVSQSKPVASTAPLLPRCRMLHEKYIVIDTPGLREVLSGSKDLASGKYQINDNQEMINRSAGVVASFRNRFLAMYRGARAC